MLASLHDTRLSRKRAKLAHCVIINTPMGAEQLYLQVQNRPAVYARPLCAYTHKCSSHT